jgi:pimeloyl-ACP methyl ester carboxylesterase
MLTVPVQTTLMILAVLLGSLVLLVVAGAIYQAIGTWQDHQRFPPSASLVRVNERQMHIHVTGEGPPTVVFESGMGASCLSWTLVQPQVAQFTRAASYDRAGHGWSAPARERRTAEQIAQELHTLLDAAAVPGPYVLVGHSFGGYVNRAFAHMYRNEVVGMVLVDSIHPAEWENPTPKQLRISEVPCDTRGLRRGSHDWVLLGFASPGWLEVRPGWHGRR